jgi:hypothetical protein
VADQPLAQECGVPGISSFGTTLATPWLKASIPKPRRTTMKFETLMLHSLFAACLLVCVLVLGAMLTTRATVASIASNHAATSVPARSAG